MDTFDLKDNEILVLRTSDKERKSYKSFQWPESGPVSAPDWIENNECGNGLHGLPCGVGDGSLLDWSNESTAQLVIVDTSHDYRAGDGNLDRKRKFKSGRVVFSKINGIRDAIEILSEIYLDVLVVGGTATAGYDGTATAGENGIIVIKRWDGKRYRVCIGYVGEDGIEPNKKYKLDKAGKFIAVEPAE